MPDIEILEKELELLAIKLNEVREEVQLKREEINKARIEQAKKSNLVGLKVYKNDTRGDKGNIISLILGPKPEVIKIKKRGTIVIYQKEHFELRHVDCYRNEIWRDLSESGIKFGELVILSDTGKTIYEYDNSWEIIDE